MLSTHHAGDRFDAVAVRDDADLGVELIFAGVEGENLLPGLGAAHDQIALDLRRVEDVQRPATVEGYVVGDVDQRIDRAQPDREQALLHPLRRRAVPDAAHQPQRKTGTQVRRVDRHLDRAGAVAGHRVDRAALQCAEAGRGEIAGNAVDSGRVGPVRRQVDLDHRVVELRPCRERRSDRSISRQVDDAVMLVGELQFAFRAHHAAAFDTANGADRQRHVDAGHIGSGRGEGADQTGARIGRAADHLHRVAGACIDHQHAQLVRVGMLFGAQHLRDDKGLQPRLVVDGFDLEPDHGQPLADLVERGVGVEMVLEPREGELHVVGPSGLGTLDFTWRGSESGMCT